MRGHLQVHRLSFPDETRGLPGEHGPGWPGGREGTLKEGRIRGAALDVHESEPFRCFPLAPGAPGMVPTLLMSGTSLRLA